MSEFVLFINESKTDEIEIESETVQNETRVTHVLLVACRFEEIVIMADDVTSCPLTDRFMYGVCPNDRALLESSIDGPP